jgi:type I restriction enzyme S subunit
MVKEGYKQIEVGVIPCNWEYCNVDFLIKEGLIEKPLDGNHGNIHPKSSDYVSEGIPFIMANDIVDGKINLKSCHFIRKQQADKLQKGFSVSGDVLLTHKGTVGNIALLGEHDTEYIMLTPQVTYYRVKDGNRLNNLFVKSYFESRMFQSVLDSLSGGGTRAYIGIQKQRELPFILPPLQEQQAIAQALSDVDSLIDGLEKLIAKKRDIKTATMQQLLTGKTRLPGFGEGKGYKQTELGKIPEDRDLKTFGELAYVRNVKVDSKRSGGGHFCIDLEHLSQGSGFLLGATTTTSDSSLKVYFKKGDILFGKLRAYLRKYWLADRGGVTSTEIWPIAAREGMACSGFVYQLVQTDEFIECASTAYGTHMPRSDWKLVSRLLIKSPCLDEQGAIAEVLNVMGKELSALQSRLEKTKAIKQGMMQELLTGKTRLI